jgi:hypothetical protein
MSCTAYKDSGGTRDECLTCGCPAEEHGLPAKPPVKSIKILFAGKFWEFTDWQEARKHGFYLY